MEQIDDNQSLITHWENHLASSLKGVELAQKNLERLRLERDQLVLNLGSVALEATEAA